MTVPDPDAVPANDGDARSTGPKEPTWRKWAAASAATALGVVAGSVFVSASDDGSAAAAATREEANGSDQAEQGPPGPGPGFRTGRAGEVTAVDGDTLTIAAAARDGDTTPMTIRTSDDTDVSEVVDGTVADLAVGDEVVVVGRESEGEVTARSVTVGDAELGPFGSRGPHRGGEPPEDGEPPADVEPPADGEPPADVEPPADGERPPGRGGRVMSGEIVAVDGSTLTLQSSDDETVDVELAEDVTVRIIEIRSVSDIEVGDTIRAFGDTEDDEVRTTDIVIGDPASGPGGPGRFGGRPGTGGAGFGGAFPAPPGS